MTDYNDGKWHGWNGGKCPVHPESVVAVRNRFGHDGYVSENTDVAGWFDGAVWTGEGENPVVAFRVVKAYREPREAWAVGKRLHDTEAEAQDFLDRLRSENPTHGFAGWRVIRMVEVLE